MLRMEQLSPSWPKYRAKLEIPPQADRYSLSQWEEGLPGAIEREKQFLRSDDRAENDGLQLLWAIESLLQLPSDIIIAARKRLFGGRPPVNANGEVCFSNYELQLITGALWGYYSPGHDEYWSLKVKAERSAKTRQHVNNIFRDLRTELN